MKERKKKSGLLNFEVSKDRARILSWGVEVLKKIIKIQISIY